MAAINTRVVHRANALMNFKYGEGASYTEIMATANGPLEYGSTSKMLAESAVCFSDRSMLAVVSGIWSLDSV